MSAAAGFAGSGQTVGETMNKEKKEGK